MKGKNIDDVITSRKKKMKEVARNLAEKMHLHPTIYYVNKASTSVVFQSFEKLAEKKKLPFMFYYQFKKGLKDIFEQWVEK